MTTSQGFTKAGAAVLALATASLAGCAVTGGSPSRASGAPGVADHVVCSGGHASRFPEREAVGRICRPTMSLRTIY